MEKGIIQNLRSDKKVKAYYNDSLSEEYGLIYLKEMWDSSGNHSWSFNESEFIPAENMEEAFEEYKKMVKINNQLKKQGKKGLYKI